VADPNWGAREVTLLPRHWQWLNEQPGGASVALRKLVEEARRANRALFAHDSDKFAELIARWPDDVRVHALLSASS